MTWRRAGLLVCFGLLAACGRGAAWKAYFHDDPLPYYLFVPQGITNPNPPALMVGLLGEAGDIVDCFDLWQKLAEERGMALICPELAGGDSLIDNIDADRDLGTVLTDVYASQALQPRFFLAGYGDAGAFALSYALQFPQVVSGVAVMAVDEFPAPSANASNIPFLLALGDDDRARKPAADAATEAWRQMGLSFRLVSIRGDDRQPTQDFARLAAELCQQTSR
ncbi:MAG TPA: hypothetical protein VLD63_07995 [Anaerolineales bacterium]|nr:hypothetical protein [Anaerolineales bacterium]